MDILSIFFFDGLQGKYIRKYKEDGNTDSIIFPILIGLAWNIVFFLIVLVILSFTSGSSMWKSVELMATGQEISETKEYKDYVYALEKENDLTKKPLLMAPFYKKYNNHDVLGAETSYLYAVANFQAGKFDTGKIVLEDALQKYPDNEEIRDLKNSMNVFQDIDAYREYYRAVNEYINNGRSKEALPILIGFHQMNKDNTFLQGETYYNLGIAMINSNMIEQGKHVIEEGAKLFPRNNFLQELKNKVITE